METKIYKGKNGTVYVMLPESRDRKNLIKATEEFLKKVMNGEHKNGNNY